MEDDINEPRDEQTFRLLFESIQDYAIFVMNPDGIVKTWNPGAEIMKGYRADEIVGQSFSRFYLSSDIEAGKPHMLLSHAARAGRVTDGPKRWVSTSGLLVITALYDQRETLTEL